MHVQCKIKSITVSLWSKQGCSGAFAGSGADASAALSYQPSTTLAPCSEHLKVMKYLLQDDSRTGKPVAIILAPPGVMAMLMQLQRSSTVIPVIQGTSSVP